MQNYTFFKDFKKYFVHPSKEFAQCTVEQVN